MFDNCYDIQIIILERREKTGIGRNKTNETNLICVEFAVKKKNISKQLF